MHAEQLINPRSNVPTFKRFNAPTFQRSCLPIFNFQSSTFNRWHLILEKMKIQITIEEQILLPLHVPLCR
jgi:hypothetical protein